jgi:hypothetical protein
VSLPSPFLDRGIAGPPAPGERVGRVAGADGSMVVTVAPEAPAQLTMAEYREMQDAMHS